MQFDRTVNCRSTLLNTREYKYLEGFGKLVTDIVLQVLSWFAEEERKNIKQRKGIDAAQKKSIKLGRKKIEISEEFKNIYSQWKTGSITAVNAMEQLKLKPNTFYRR